MLTMDRVPPLVMRYLVLGVLAVVPRGIHLASDSAVLKGVVADTSGRPLAGARVAIWGDGVGAASTRSAPDGTYRFPGLQPFAEYRIGAALAGYRGVEYEGMRLEAGRTRAIDFRLKRPDEREVALLVSRDPFPYADLVRGFSGRLAVGVRLVDLDAETDPIEAVRRVSAERPNLILGAGLRAARLIRSYVREVPAILTLLSDPRHFDLEAANICFVANNPDPRDVLRRFTALLPGARRIGLIYQAEDSSLLAKDLREAASEAGLRMVLAPCRDARGVEAALSRFEGTVEALLVPFDRLTASPGVVDRIEGWAQSHRVPLDAPDAEWVRRGALFAYAVSPERIGEEASALASQILSGTRQPADFDLHLPHNPLLSVNLRTAESLGVTIPGDLPVDVAY